MQYFVIIKVGDWLLMDDMILERNVQYLCNSSAKELYNLSLYLYGNEASALKASVDSFVIAFIKMSGETSVLDTILFRKLSIRYLYKFGKKNITHSKTKRLPKILNQLNYNERFIILLFCCSKMKIEHISHILRLPRILVLRCLLSAAQKVMFYNQEN
jgi:hypothetical protein